MLTVMEICRLPQVANAGCVFSFLRFIKINYRLLCHLDSVRVQKTYDFRVFIFTPLIKLPELVHCKNSAHVLEAIPENNKVGDFPGCY